MSIQALLISVKDTAILLGISDKTIRNQISLKKFRFEHIKLGGRTLFRMSDIQAFASAPTPTPEAAPAPARRGPARKIVSTLRSKS